MNLKAFVIVALFAIFLAPTAWAEETPDSLKELSKRFRNETASRNDSLLILNYLSSKEQSKLSLALRYAPFVALRFPDLRSSFEEAIVNILNDPDSKMKFQAAETSLSIAFKRSNAQKLAFIIGDDEINLVKAIIKERVDIFQDQGPEFFISQCEPTILNQENRHFEAQPMKEVIMNCELFRQIGRIAYKMRYYQLAFRFFKIIKDHPDEFTPHCVDDASAFLGKYEAVNPRKFPETFDGKEF